MITVYCIEDINDIKYVGSTKDKLHTRLTAHRQSKKRNNNTSSKFLNLEYCIIYPLETCEESERKERERYWISKTDCVNTRTLDKMENYHKNYYQKNKERIKERSNIYYHKKKQDLK